MASSELFQTILVGFSNTCTFDIALQSVADKMVWETSANFFKFLVGTLIEYLLLRLKYNAKKADTNTSHHRRGGYYLRIHINCILYNQSP